MKFKDDTFVTIEDEFKQIQSCVGMYISTGGTDGAVHLFKEMFNNALDECINERSPANNITVVFNRKTQEISVADNGRGIPFEKMVEVCSKKHSSTKIGDLRQFNKKSAGCNGVGLTVTVAFSQKFVMKCDRGDKSKTIVFNNCNLTEGEIVKNKKEKYGTYVSFIPSKKYLGDFDIQVNELEEWLRHISYILPKDVTINFVVMKNDEEVDYTKTYEALSLSDNVSYFDTNGTMEFNPIEIGFESDDLDLSFAFSYDKSLSDEITESYANYVITVDGGYHVVACKRALSDFLLRECKKDNPESKYPVISEDIKRGLVMAINCDYAHPILGGQTKSKLENKEIVSDGKPKLTAIIDDYFSKNRTLLDKIIKYLRQVAKARLESYKIRGAKPPKVLSVFDEAGIANYHGVSDRNKKGYKELIITEGKSASGAILSVRNPKFQAVYTTGGVMDNCADMSFADMIKANIPRDLATILGVEIGPDADITNLRFDKIICLQDADADGYNIKSLVCCFLLVSMPKLVEEGKLYTGVPPLYNISDRSFNKYKKFMDKNFIFDKHEYQSLIGNIISTGVKIQAFNGKDFEDMDKGEIKSWLRLNRLYLDILNALSKKTACHPDIIEVVCEALCSYTTEKVFSKKLNSVYPEMSYDSDTKSYQGIYKFKNYGIVIDDLFINMTEKLTDLIAENPAFMYRFKNANKDENDAWTSGTIGQTLAQIHDKFVDIDITQRFKGLGEVKPQLMFYSTLNPKVRKLVRLTMDDRKKVMEDLALLHGKNNAQARRDMLFAMDIEEDDLDN